MSRNRRSSSLFKNMDYLFDHFFNEFKKYGINYSRKNFYLGVGNKVEAEVEPKNNKFSPKKTES